MANPYWYPEQEQAEKVMYFILWFSRYEYALKNGGYYKKGKDKLEPDWHTFVQYLEKHSLPESLSGELDYLKKEPPKMQMVDKNWISIPYKTDWDLLIRSLTNVRNNLFHGGKHEDSKLLSKERDRILIDISLKLMQEMRLICPPEVHDFLI